MWKLNKGDVIGNGFTFIQDVSHRGEKRRSLFLCECGKQIESNTHSITSKKKKSCGCKAFGKTANRYSHGLIHTPEYHSWQSMKARCYKSSDPKDVKFYQEKGIIVCDRWKNSFENFYLDMGKRPSLKHSLDRIDNNGNYKPNNCRWADQVSQANNKSSNLNINLGGIELTVAQWCDKLNLNRKFTYGRIKKGWSERDSLFYPTQKEIKQYENIGIKILPRDKNINLV